MLSYVPCHAADGPPPQVVPRTIYGNFLAVDGPPQTKCGCHRWSPFAASGPQYFLACFRLFEPNARLQEASRT